MSDLDAFTVQRPLLQGGCTRTVCTHVGPMQKVGWKSGDHMDMTLPSLPKLCTDVMILLWYKAKGS